MCVCSVSVRCGEDVCAWSNTLADVVRSMLQKRWAGTLASACWADHDTNERLCECRTACTRVHEKSFECYGVRCSLERGSRVDSRTGPFKLIHRVVEVTVARGFLFACGACCHDFIRDHCDAAPPMDHKCHITNPCAAGTIADHRIARPCKSKACDQQVGCADHTLEAESALRRKKSV